MSTDPQPESQPYSQNYQNYPPQNSINTFRLELNANQTQYLAKLLPTGYSFQLETKHLKRNSSSQKSIKDQVKIPPQVKKKNTKDEPKNTDNKAGTNRNDKTNKNRVNQELQNIVYEKYNSQKEYRRNSFQNISEALRPCLRILNLLKNSKTSWPFREPVDPIAFGIPRYAQIVKEPMDLSTIENNLRTNQYVTPTQFHADVSKIITNSYTFNSSNMEFTRITAEFQNYYKKITLEPSSDLARGYSQDMPPQNYVSKISSLEIKKSKKESKETEYHQSSIPVISMAQKKELGMNIKKLPKQYMKGILDIVNEGKGKIIGEFDLKELDPLIIRKLQVYVKEKLSNQGKVKGVGGDKNNHDNQQESSFEVREEDDS